MSVNKNVYGVDVEGCQKWRHPPHTERQCVRS